tara:strand:+ start:850 stop:1938 length:1089 start_codon:yes stop_codon:yes gene_type:complete
MINIKIGDCIEVLKTLPKNHFDTVVTSPPYYGLRDYNTGTWVGGDPNCPHKRLTKISKDTATGHANMYDHGDVVGDAIYRQKCPICGAERQDSQIGLELTPQDYVRRLVEVFRGVRDTLKEDGTVWLNLGDTYHNYRADGLNVKQTLHKDKHDQPEVSPNRANKIQGLKEKDLMGIPWRVAFALQEDGWYLRQDIIWHKPNPMPESVKDRCTKAHEYIFLLSKNSHYYFDNEAIQEEAKDWGTRDRSNGKYHNEGTGLSPHTGLEKSYETKNKRSVWTVNTKPYKEAHFAVFPTDLIEPCIKAGCPKDGHVLDPFGGSGTTGLVADRLNRNATIIELNKDYVEIAEDRLMGETPLFTKVNIK